MAKPSPQRDTSMLVSVDERRKAVEALRAFQAANVALRQRLRQTETGVGRIVRDVERGDAIIDTLERQDQRSLRCELVDELERFERSRHEMRVALFGVALSEDTTVAELARVWGFSRQLGSRFAKQSAAASRPARRARCNPTVPS